MKRILLRIGVALVLGLSLFALLALAPVEGRRGSGSPQGVEQGIIRFRVIAASDRPDDQALKLKVRDAVLELLRPELEKARDERSAAAVIEKALPRIRRVAEETVRKEGQQLPVEVSWGVTEFPTKAYGPVVFPAGRYLALKIVIGEGEGRNWWCVLFPPLCYVDLTRAAGSASGRPGDPVWDGDSVYLVGKGYREVKGPLFRTKIGELLAGGRRTFLSWVWRRES
ncbi:MAG: stage II sporulation protein R [Thermacetogeniaceae bacterium]